MNAWEELNNALSKGERLEAVVFGHWGWDGFDEPEPPIVPNWSMGVVMKPEEARPYMEKYSIKGGFGAAMTYAMYAYSNTRIYWVAEYDGSTALKHAPRNPTNGIFPQMS